MIICEIIVHLLVKAQNNKRCTVQGIEIKRNLTSFVKENPLIGSRFEPALRASTRNSLPVCKPIDAAELLTRLDLPRISEITTGLW